MDKGCSRPGSLHWSHLDEDLQVLQIISAPFVEGLQQLQPVTLRVDIHPKAGAVSGWMLVCVLAWVKVFGGEFVSSGGLQLKPLTIRSSEIVGLWVEA